MTLKKLVASTLLAAGLSLTASAAADAKVFNFFYDIGKYNGHGKIVADLTAPGVYTIESATGVANGSAITSLSPYAGADQQLFYSPGSNQTYFDWAGYSFSTSANTYNLYGDGASYGVIDALSNPGGFDQGLRGSLVSVSPASGVAPVPELSTFVLMTIGIAGLCFGGAKKRRTRELPI